MSWVVRVFGPGTGYASPYSSSFKVNFDHYEVKKKEHVVRLRNGGLYIKTEAHVRTSGDRTWNVPSTEIYYMPDKVTRYVIYRKGDES